MYAHDEHTVRLTVTVPTEVIGCDAPQKRDGDVDWNRNQIREAVVFFQSEIFKGDFHSASALVLDDHVQPPS